MNDNTSYPFIPLGLSREEAAFMVGVRTTLFDEMVKDGRMPQPHMAGSRVVWDRDEVSVAFKALPKKGETKSGNPWDGKKIESVA